MKKIVEWFKYNFRMCAVYSKRGKKVGVESPNGLTEVFIIYHCCREKSVDELQQAL